MMMSVRMVVFWDVAKGSVVDTGRRFIGTYYFKCLRESYPRRQPSSLVEVVGHG